MRKNKIRIGDKGMIMSNYRNSKCLSYGKRYLLDDLNFIKFSLPVRRSKYNTV